jgi:hypothetical protein
MRNSRNLHWYTSQTGIVDNFRYRQKDPGRSAILRSHRHHDIVALGFGRIRACAIGSHASRSSGALFNSLSLSSARLIQ